MAKMWTRFGIRPTKLRDRSTRDLTGIVAITKDVLVLRRLKFRAVIKVGSVNTDLMTDFEQQVFDKKFGQLLNSLNFPIQLVVRPRKSELFPYLKQLEQTQKQPFASKYRNFLQDHYLFVGEMSRVHQAVERPKWIIVPWDAEEINKCGYDDDELYNGKIDQVNEKLLQEAQAQLGSRCDLIFRALRKMELSGWRLGTRELYSLCFDFFNPTQAGVLEQLFTDNDVARFAVEGIDT